MEQVLLPVQEVRVPAFTTFFCCFMVVYSLKIILGLLGGNMGVSCLEFL